MRTLITAVLAAGALSACVSVPSTPSSSAMSYLTDARLGPQVAEICSSDPAYAFRGTTDRTVILNLSGQDYLVETEEYCSELPGTLNLNTVVPEDHQCVTPGSKLVAFAYGGVAAGIPSTGFVSRCRIKAIYEWDESQQRTTVASID